MMTRHTATWPAIAAAAAATAATTTPLLILVVVLVVVCATPATGFLPLTTTTTTTTTHTRTPTPPAFCSALYRSGTCTSLLPVAATPMTVSPLANSTSDDSNNNNNKNNNDDNDDDSFNINKYSDLLEANMALDALAMKCSNPKIEPIIQRADECQTRWEDMHGTHLEPDTVSFNTVLKAWSKCCHGLAEQRRHYSDSSTVTTLGGLEGGGSSEFFNSLAQLATANKNDHPQVYTAKDAAERATLLLLSQEQDYDNGVITESARPDTQSYNEAIGAWARSGVAEAPQNAERLLKRMLEHEYIQPDGLSYNSVVDAWAYSGKPEAVPKVRQIWQHMEQLYNDNRNNNDDDKPTSTSANFVEIKPTIRTVNSIIHAHAKRVQELVEARDQDSARKVAREAEEFLNLMKERYEQTKDPDYMPDVMTYTSVMDTYGRCAKYGSTKRAQTLLRELKELYNEGKNPKLKPNVRTYTSLIMAWSKTFSPDSPREAEFILEEMSQSKDIAVRPNARTYMAAIHAWARSADHTKAQHALRLLKTNKDLYKKTGRPELKPSLGSYNAALDACARCQGDLHQQTDALKIAFAIFKAVAQDSEIEANSITYATLLRACSFLLQPGEERNNVSKAVFEKAKKAGMVDFRVMLQLKKSADPALFSELLKDDLSVDRNGNYDFNTLPPNWARNVR